MKKVAIVGFGFMGRTHYGCWRKQKGAKVVAICDMNLAQLTSSVKGNLGRSDDPLDLTGVSVYEDFDKMLAAGGFDVVDITLPTRLHPAMVVKALEAGYHVFCEKPMALSAKDCDRMLAAAKKSKGRLLVGQCVRFSPAARLVKKFIETKKYGEVATAFFSRVSMTPGWSAKGGPNWYLDESKSGGVALDLHIHDTDLVQHFFGKPKSVSSRGHWSPERGMDHITTSYDFGNTVVTAEGNWGAARTFVFEANFRIVFDRAVVIYDTKREHALTVFPEKGEPIYPPCDADPYEAEIRAFLAWISGKKADLPLAAEDARNSVAIVDAERASAKAGGRAVRIR